MSLVDYPSDDDVLEEDERQVKPPSPPSITHQIPPPLLHRFETSLNDQKPKTSVVEQCPPPLGKLPDAWSLLNSPSIPKVTGTSHASCVAVSTSENVSQKRNSKGSESPSRRGKLPRSSLAYTKTFPDTGGGLLVPPQLTGRSNVVTEDIGKLFVKKHVIDDSEDSKAK